MPVLKKLLGLAIVLCGLLLIFGAMPVFAATPRVAWLAAAPAPAGKFEVLARAARERGFELDARYLEKLDDAGLAHFAGSAQLLIVETPRPGLLDTMLGRLGPAWSERKGARLLIENLREITGEAGRNPSGMIFGAPPQRSPLDKR